MFRNNYDGDTVTYSPQGRIFQVEYACEAVKQGSAVVAIAGAQFVVMAALKRHAEELSSYQKKIKPVASNAGLGFSGHSADARKLTIFLEQSTFSHQQIFSRPTTVREMAFQMAQRMQDATQGYGSRPFGTGFLLCGYDTTGPHLYEVQPSASYTEMLCAGIGARSQMSRTYLERHLDEFKDASKDELIIHVIKGLAESLEQHKSLDNKNTSVAIVGLDHPFTVFEGEDLDAWLAAAKPEEETEEAPAADGDAPADGAAPADGDAPADAADEDDGTRMEVDS